jgi:hypothetical protein
MELLNAFGGKSMAARKIDGEQRRRLFAIAKELGFDIERLRTIAEQYNEKLPKEKRHSISALTRYNANAMIWDLQKEVSNLPGRNNKPEKLTSGMSGQPAGKINTDHHGEKRPDGKEWDYRSASDGGWSQSDYMFDLVIKLGWNIWEFRAFIKKYFRTDNEDWLGTAYRMKTIEALKAMVARKNKKATKGRNAVRPDNKG